MDINKLNTGEKIAGVSAILLFVFMFFDWFGVEISGEGGTVSFGSGAGGNAWDALDFIPIILVIAIVVALINVFLRLSDSDYEPPVSMNVGVAILGGLSTLLILFRIIDPPGFGTFGGVSVDATLEFGIFLGLLAAIGIAFGGYRAMQEEGSSFSGAADKLSSGGGPGAGAPPPPSSTPPPPPPPSGSTPPPPPSSSGPPPPPPPPPPAQ
jgi:hypothetical protein